MKAPLFEYVAPTSLDDALATLADAGEDAKVLAGGQSLVPMMALRLAQPAVLIDLNGIVDLGRLVTSGGGLDVGAMVRHKTVERSREVAESVPLLAAAMPWIGHAAIRSRGTIGGSLAHADPAAELPAVAIALDALFVARSRERGERMISAEDFFAGYFTTTLEPDEILCSITFPVLAESTGFAIEEVARRHGDFAMVGAVAAVRLEDDVIADVRLALINVADRPMRAHAVEDALRGQKATEATFADAAAGATRELDPSGDLHASPEYRRKVGAVCIRRALASATSKARGDQ